MPRGTAYIHIDGTYQLSSLDSLLALNCTGTGVRLSLYHVSYVWQPKEIFFFKKWISLSVSVTWRMKLLTIFNWSSQGISDEWHGSYITVSIHPSFWWLMNESDYSWGFLSNQTSWRVASSVWFFSGIAVACLKGQREENHHTGEMLDCQTTLYCCNSGKQNSEKPRVWIFHYT